MPNKFFPKTPLRIIYDIGSNTEIKCTRMTVLYPVDTGCKLIVHKKFKRRPGGLLKIYCTLNLRPVAFNSLKENIVII